MLDFLDIFISVLCLLLLFTIGISPLFLCIMFKSGWYAFLFLITIPGAVSGAIKLGER